MPQVGWLDSSGKIVSFEDALKIAETTGTWEQFPYEVLRGMHENVTKERPDASSVTQLLGCPRKVYLEATHEFAVPPVDNYPTFRGMIIHGILAPTAADDERSETRIEKEWRGVTLSGAPDSLRIIRIGEMAVKRTLLRDWKSTKTLPMYDSAYTNHQQQINLYRWMLDLDPHTTDLEIVYVSMEGIKVIALKRGGTSRYGRKMPDQVWSNQQVEDFLDEKLLVLNAQRKYGTPVAYEKVPIEDLWQCPYCPVRDICYAKAAVEARAAWAAGENVERVPPRAPVKKGKKS